MKEPGLMNLDRTNTGLLGRWWWTVDRMMLLALLILMGIGAVMVTAASPPVAARIGLNEFHFVFRQGVFLVMALVIMLSVSLLEMQQLRRLSVFLFLAMLLLLMILPFVGATAKGAQRWLSIAGFSLQPSEIIKPCFAVVIAWMFAEKQRSRHFPGYKIALFCYGLVAGLLIIQPDFGMTMTISVMFGAQLFLGGLPVIWVILMGVLGIGGIILAYYSLDHVARRIDSFLDPATSENYQVNKSLEAIQSGGVLGRGPGEGVVKWSIPDSHTDFIFAVVSEEFGLLVSLLVIVLYGFYPAAGVLAYLAGDQSVCFACGNRDFGAIWHAGSH